MLYSLGLMLVSHDHSSMVECVNRIFAKLCSHGESCVKGKGGWILYSKAGCLLLVESVATIRPSLAQPAPLASFEARIKLQCAEAESAVKLVSSLNSIVLECRNVTLLLRGN